jgi:hypothetical protein
MINFNSKRRNDLFTKISKIDSNLIPCVGGQRMYEFDKKRFYISKSDESVFVRFYGNNNSKSFRKKEYKLADILKYIKDNI